MISPDLLSLPSVIALLGQTPLTWGYYNMMRFPRVPCVVSHNRAFFIKDFVLQTAVWKTTKCLKSAALTFNVWKEHSSRVQTGPPHQWKRSPPGLAPPLHTDTNLRPVPYLPTIPTFHSPHVSGVLGPLSDRPQRMQEPQSCLQH